MKGTSLPPVGSRLRGRLVKASLRPNGLFLVLTTKTPSRYIAFRRSQGVVAQWAENTLIERGV